MKCLHLIYKTGRDCYTLIEAVKLDGMIKINNLNPGFKNIPKVNKIYSDNTKTSDLFILDQFKKEKRTVKNLKN